MLLQLISPQEGELLVKLGGLGVAYAALKLVTPIIKAKYYGGPSRRLGDMDPTERDEHIARIISSAHDIQDERLAHIVAQAIGKQNEILIPALRDIATALASLQRMHERAEDRDHKMQNVLAILLERTQKVNGKGAGT
jgi:hypothetical protein